MTVFHVPLIAGKAARGGSQETLHAMSVPGFSHPSGWTTGKLGCLLLHPFNPCAWVGGPAFTSFLPWAARKGN